MAYNDILVFSIRQNACKQQCGLCPKKAEPCIDRMALQAAEAIEELCRENESLARSVNEVEEILHNRKPKWISVEELAKEIAWLIVEAMKQLHPFAKWKAEDSELIRGTAEEMLDWLREEASDA